MIAESNIEEEILVALETGFVILILSIIFTKHTNKRKFLYSQHFRVL